LAYAEDYKAFESAIIALKAELQQGIATGEMGFSRNKVIMLARMFAETRWGLAMSIYPRLLGIAAVVFGFGPSAAR
jgi:hypothetical protein